MKDPVIGADDHTYERAEIQQWLQRTSAMTREMLYVTFLIPNYALRKTIEAMSKSKDAIKGFIRTYEALLQKAQQLRNGVTGRTRQDE